VRTQPSARGETAAGVVPRGEMVLWVDSWVNATKVCVLLAIF
jgi:hypothetical protein